VGDIQAEPQEERWLIEGLWTRRAVGVLGGPPKAFKTFLGLDIALSVATGTPCLSRFPVHETGPVLAYLAEDAAAQVRARIAALAKGRGLTLEALDLFLVTSPVLWLDDPEHRQRLARTIEDLHPKLLLLDPLVRLHRQDENDVRAVSALLGHLRELNRTYDLAVVLVHHTSKKERANPGQALRGSGDIHAWLDVGLYLAKRRSGIVLTVEHRSAAAPEPLALALVTGRDGSARLTASDPGPDTGDDGPRDLAAAAVDEIGKAGEPLTRNALRARLGVRNESLGGILSSLEKKGRIERKNGGWALPGNRAEPQSRDLTSGLLFS
jgi:hypothetical protein